MRLREKCWIAMLTVPLLVHGIPAWAISETCPIFIHQTKICCVRRVLPSAVISYSSYNIENLSILSFRPHISSHCSAANNRQGANSIRGKNYFGRFSKSLEGLHQLGNPGYHVWRKVRRNFIGIPVVHLTLDAIKIRYRITRLAISPHCVNGHFYGGRFSRVLHHSIHTSNGESSIRHRGAVFASEILQSNPRSPFLPIQIYSSSQSLFGYVSGTLSGIRGMLGARGLGVQLSNRIIDISVYQYRRICELLGSVGVSISRANLLLGRIRNSGSIFSALPYEDGTNNSGEGNCCCEYGHQHAGTFRCNQPTPETHPSRWGGGWYFCVGYLTGVLGILGTYCCTFFVREGRWWGIGCIACSVLLLGSSVWFVVHSLSLR